MLRIAVFLLAGIVSTVVAAQAYPSRPIRLIVPFAPGGNIGADAVAKSAPDGYTLLFGTNTLTMNAFLVKQMPFDVQKDLAPVAMVATTPFIVVVNNDLPVRSVAELIAYAKAHPGKLSFGSPGNGTPHHL